MRFAWKTETMVLRDHKVGITEQSQDRLGNLNVLGKWDLPMEKLRAPGPKTNIILRKTTWNHETYKTMNPWHHETYETIDTTKPMKPPNHETYETMKPLTPRHLWDY